MVETGTACPRWLDAAKHHGYHQSAQVAAGGGGLLRVLMLSKACIVGPYQRKLEELAALPGVDLTVVVPPYWREAGQTIPLAREHTSGYQLVVEPMALNGHFHLHFYPWLARQFRRVRPDVCHIDEEPYNLATFQALRLAQRTGARALFFTWQNLARRYPPPWSWVESYVLERSDYAIAGSREALGVLVQKGYSGPSAMIPQFGVDPEIYRPLETADGTASSPGFRVGYAGRLVEQKGVHLLLMALAALEGDWSLFVLGEGPKRAALVTLADELGISERVEFRKPIPSTRMPEFLNQLDVLVLPSVTRPNWKEQFGRVLVEAMACGIPVLGSDSGEIPHVIGEAGMTFPEGHVGELTRSLFRLRGDRRLRQELTEAGRRRVLEHFTQARVAAETYRVVSKMIWYSTSVGCCRARRFRSALTSFMVSRALAPGVW